MENENAPHLQSLPDDELLRRTHELAQRSRRVEADLVAHIGEVDARRLWASEAVPSMFAYCTQRLHLSEDAAYRRIEVARAARKHPVLLSVLRDGRIHLTGLSFLARHLTPGNRDRLLAKAAYQPKRRIEKLIAELAPRPDAPPRMRKLPERGANAHSDRWAARDAGTPPVLPPTTPARTAAPPTLRSLRTEHGVPLNAVRKALRFAERELGIQQLLLREELRTAAKSLFLDRYGELIDLSASGQLAMRKALEAHLKRVEWGALRFPCTVVPLPGNRSVRGGPAHRD